MLLLVPLSYNFRGHSLKSRYCVAPIRLMTFFGLTAYAYFRALGSAGKQSSVKDVESGLGNNVIFTWAFLETVIWFWVRKSCGLSERQWTLAGVLESINRSVRQIYVTLKEERREMARRVVEKRRLEEDAQ